MAVKKTIFILGGARSGKSGYAAERAKASRGKTAFIATALARDKEMKERIKKHKASRPREWQTIEGEIDISRVLVPNSNKYSTLLIDCLGLWINNLLMSKLSDVEIEKAVEKLIAVIKNVRAIVIIVSNDVGSGIVPDNPLSRRFRDLIGFANQKMAKAADEVIFMQAGIPIKVKSKK